MICLLDFEKKQMFWQTVIYSKTDVLDLCSYSSFCGVAALLQIMPSEMMLRKLFYLMLQFTITTKVLLFWMAFFLFNEEAK